MKNAKKGRFRKGILVAVAVVLLLEMAFRIGEPDFVSQALGTSVDYETTAPPWPEDPLRDVAGKPVPKGNFPQEFGPESFPEKALITVAVCGTSTAAGHGVEPDSTFAVYLSRKPLVPGGIRLRVRNYAHGGAAAPQVFEQVRQAVTEGADTVIVYMGDNEFLRWIPPPRFQEWKRGLVSIAPLMKMSRVFGGLVAIWRQAFFFGGQVMFSRPFEDGFPETNDFIWKETPEWPVADWIDIRARYLARFRTYTQAIIGLCSQNSRQLFLCTTAPRIKLRPFFYLPQPAAIGGEAKEIRRQFLRGLELFRSRDWKAAEEVFRAAHGWEAGSPLIAYGLAECSREQNRIQEAVDRYKVARDWSMGHLMSFPALNGIIREEGAKAGITVIDLEDVLWKGSPAGDFFGERNFLKNDACHPNSGGHQKLAQAILGTLEQAYEPRRPWGRKERSSTDFRR